MTLCINTQQTRKTVECVTIEDLAQAIEAEAVKSAEGNECELVSVWWRFGTYRELLLGYQACKRILFVVAAAS